MERSQLMVVLLTGLMATSGALFSPEAKGDPELGVSHQCEWCSNHAALESYAMSFPPGRYTVYSLSHGIIMTVDVQSSDSSVDPARGTGETRQAAASGTSLTHVPTPAAIVTGFGMLSDYFNFTKGTNHAIVDVYPDQLNLPSAATATVYEIVRSQNLRLQIERRLANPSEMNLSGIQQVVERAFSEASALARSRLGVTPEGRLTFVFHTADGGQVVFKWVIGALAAEYQEGSSRTPGEQLVPDAPIVDRWQGTEDLAPLLHHMAQMGVPVGPPNPAATVGPLIELECVRHEGDLMCRIVER